MIEKLLSSKSFTKEASCDFYYFQELLAAVVH